MPERIIRVGHGNVHNGHTAIKAALAMDCDVFGFNEAGKRRAFIRTEARLLGYRVHAARPTFSETKPGRDVSGDTTTLVRNRFEHIGEWQQRVTEQVDRMERIAPDRWFNATCFGFDGLDVAHFNIHPHPVPPGLRDRPNLVTRGYEESMKWLDLMLYTYRKQGFALLVTGDFNIPDLAVDPAFSPYPILRNHGLRNRTSHIDGIAWSHRDFGLSQFNVVPKEQFKSDHPALRAVLEIRR